MPRRVTWKVSPAAARCMYQPKRLRNSLAPTCIAAVAMELMGLEPDDLLVPARRYFQLSYSP